MTEDVPVEFDRDAWWERVAKHGPYDSVERTRDAIDRPDWRQVEARQRMAEEASGQPPREVDPEAGKAAGRSYRQVNVKLSAPDFESLVLLALKRDVAPSTMARMLLRGAVAEAIGAPLRD